MRSHRLKRLGSCTAAAVGIVLLVSGLATTPAGAATPRSDPRSAEAAKAELTTALQRDLGLTPAQAAGTLTRQTHAANLDAALRTRLGAEYAGSWYDVKTGTLTVAVTRSQRVAAVRATGAQATVVARSKQALDRVKAGLDGLVKKNRAALAGATTWSVDVRRNDVVVTAAKGSTAAVKRSVARFGSAVRVVESGLAPQVTADYLDGGDPYNGCSVGFNVTRGGVGHFLTAGHCGTAGTIASANGVTIGPFVQSFFPGDDDALVRNDNPGYWIQGPWVFAYSGDPGAVYNINGYKDSPVGTAVCKSGRTTGLTCGVIRAKNETVNYAQGAVYQLTRHSACVEQGDSGGSNFSWDANGNYAEGITSGASLRSDGSRLRCLGAFGQESVSWYQPVAESISYYGVTLMTV